MKEPNSLLAVYEHFQQSFGIEIKRKEKKPLPTFTPPENNEGALFTRYSGGLFYSTTVDLNKSSAALQSEVFLIDRYRDMECFAEVENAIDEIINELIVIDEEMEPVQIQLDSVDLNDTTKKKIKDEWANVLKLFHFKKSGYDIAKRWYVDGRIFYHLMIDPDNPNLGIQEVRFIDPRKIKKVIEPRTPKTEAEKQRLQKLRDARMYVQPEYDEYYYYTEMGIGSNMINGLKVAPDSVAYAHSGLLDFRAGIVISHLHKAMKPFNLLRMLEDAFIIYKLSRAPSRRVFSIDVSNLPPAVAEKYLQAVADRYKNKVAYDASTGEITNERMHMTMLQDFFLAQREGKGTQVSELPGGGEGFTQMEHVDYHLKKLYRALNIPITRIQEGGAFSFGRPSEISRDEVKFNKFIRRLRNRFIVLLEKTLEIQLVLKKVMSREEFIAIREDIRYDFLQDNLFTELKALDMWAARIGALSQMVTFATKEMGAFFSYHWLKRNILQMSEDEIEAISDEAEEESNERNAEGIPPPMPAVGPAGAPSLGQPGPGAVPQLNNPGTSYQGLLSSGRGEDEYFRDDEFTGSVPNLINASRESFPASRKLRSYSTGHKPDYSG